ncbi:DUF6597 domain-containing transcriptional factor [Streptomyces sp. NBC_00344]|uniref:DUF6597 domain-containing transcriptional factor n=1 Tax=Streptomyces sp. NBC_00344 TaxID=2975720 RepID=UPI002E21F5BC
MYAQWPSRLEGAVVWTRTVQGPDDHPVLPDGCMDLIWTDGILLVAGPDTRAHLPEASSATRYAGVRFAPGCGPALLGVPAYELRDRRVGLTDLWPAAVTRRLTDRVDGASDHVAALESVVLRRAAEAEPPDPLLRAVAEQLDTGRSVAGTAESVGLGARQLHRRSLDAFGYGPKTLARVLRLQRALALVAAGAPYAYAAIAAGCTDQAHLAREMRGLAGMSLSSYVASNSYVASANSDTSDPSGSSTVA